MLDTLTPYLAFGAALFVAVVIPGPGIAALVGRAMGSSSRATMPFVFGIAVGDTVFLSLAVVGLSVLAQQFAGAFLAVKVAGGLYLLWLAWSFWTADAEARTVKARTVSGSAWRTALGGFLVTMGNPKAIVFYSALLPNVIDLASVGLVEWAGLVAVTWFAVFAATTPYVLATTRASGLLSAPEAMKRLQRAAAGFIGAAGVLILAEAAWDAR
ncbi:LysE family translocator [Rhizobiaceae bacterium]|nr:LysE family translocator [Rhizobiaceae bacterium]